MSGNGDMPSLLFCPFCAYRHARIICTDGTESADFATVSKGKQVVEELVRLHKISANTVPVFMIGFEKVRFQPDDPELEEVFDEMVREKTRLLGLLISQQRGCQPLS